MQKEIKKECNNYRDISDKNTSSRLYGRELRDLTEVDFKESEEEGKVASVQEGHANTMSSVSNK